MANSNQVNEQLKVYESLRTINKRIDEVTDDKAVLDRQIERANQNIGKLDAESDILKKEANDLLARLGLEKN